MSGKVEKRRRHDSKDDREEETRKSTPIFSFEYCWGGERWGGVIVGSCGKPK